MGQNEAILADDQTVIVFFRNTIFGGAIQTPIVELKGKDIEFVSIISANTKFLYKNTPMYLWWTAKALKDTACDKPLSFFGS